MSIISIQETTIDDDTITVTALLEDAHLQYPATYLDPPEYVPALCQTSFYADPEETIPTDEAGFIQYLDNLCLDWIPIIVDVSDYF